MSLIKLQGNASGTGAFTIAAPNSNTDRTLTLPDATGTVNVSGLANEVPAGSAGAPAIYPTGDSNTGIFFPAADTIAFSEGGTEAMRIDASGNLLVGRISNDTYSGNVHATGYSSVGTNQFNIVASSSSVAFEWVMRTGTEMHFYVNNASVLAKLTSSGVWTNASDARYKENIGPITYGLTEVMQLQPRTYNIIGSDKKEIGFVAQEVEPLLPELVESSRNSVTNEDRLTLSYGQLSAVLVKAIQEQQAQIEDLKAEVAALKGASA